LFPPEGEGFSMVRRIYPTYWRYTRADGRRWNDEAMIAFLKEKNPDSPWLDREIVH
jgi:hypothetical protein